MGSPPRMRGKGTKCCAPLLVMRITPAYAGKSSWRFAGTGLCWDHPRVCGEKTTNRRGRDQCRGSPPRMRGKAGGRRSAHRRTRITPAYAGKSPSERGEHHRSWDHPRVCGEKTCKQAHGAWQTGSPPRMRGKVAVQSSNSHQFRITPAYAGKRDSVLLPACWAWDHPRVCGEKFVDHRFFVDHWGSPPRMRGKAHEKEGER